MDSVQDLMKFDWWLTVRLITDELNRSHGAVHEILVALCAKIVQKNLTSEQKKNCKSVCLDSFAILKMS
jgi:hypothetical protein